MKSLTAFLLVFCAAPVWAADPPAIDSLCEDFVSAIKADDIVGFSHCWLPVRVFREIVNDPPPGIPKVPKEHHAELLKYFSQRNLEVAAKFKPIRDALLKVSDDPSKWRLVEAKAQPEKQKGVPLKIMMTSVWVGIRVAENDVFRIRIDDALFVDGRWYFTDKILGYGLNEGL